MRTVTEHIRAHLYERKGLTPTGDSYPVGNLGLAELREAEYSPEFEKLRRNRLVFGAIRYGRRGGKDKPNYDRISSCIHRLRQYRRTGNDELLVDVSNLCELEFVEGTHPEKHFASVDDGEHVGVIR